jgi:hypothetical protein
LKILKSGSCFVFLFIILLASCSPERELARDFVKSTKETPVLLLCTDRLLLTNDKLKQISGFDTLDARTQDSLWLVNSRYLDSVSDVKMLTTIYEKIRKELKSYGYKVITPDSSAAIESHKPDLITLNIAQIELSEDRYTYRDEQLFLGDLMYYYDHMLNAVNLNLWFEFTDTLTKAPKVLFSSFIVNDKLDAAFVMNQMTYNVSYKYKITPFNTEDIYTLANTAAVKSSSYFYNFLMNKYIKENLPSNVQYFKHFSYNRYYDFLYYDEDEKFTEIERDSITN